MVVENLNVVVLTFQFLVPGYIIREIIVSLYPQKNFSEGEKAIQMIAYSVFNTAVWYGPILFIQNLLQSNPVAFWICNILCVLVTGCISGFILGFLRKKECLNRILKHFHIDTLHPAPTAWDYVFSNGKTYWVEITVSNGDVIRGYYSYNSMTSSENAYHDMYIEKLYTKKNEIWTEVDRTEGAWINPEEIRYIKFYNEEE